MFPLSCADARPRSNWKPPAHTELLPRSWHFSIFIVNAPITHITKKLFKCREVVRSCKNFPLRATARPCSCEKKIGNVDYGPISWLAATADTNLSLWNSRNVLMLRSVLQPRPLPTAIYLYLAALLYLSRCIPRSFQPDSVRTQRNSVPCINQGL
jgi:hypothetical protein